MAESSKSVGIDLGTTHTVVAWADGAGGAPVVFPIPQLVAPGEIQPRALFPSCLYAPVAGETVADPWGDAPWVSGELARRRGAEVPGRLVASSKSWLCHPRVDRTAAILPWGAPDDADDLPRISPVDAAARTLAHVRRSWDAAHPEAPLAEQDVILTLPASFDEVARELTLAAATRAGLAVRLLEEPQAAFYDFMVRAGAAGLRGLLERGHGEALVLVCDVGGGTTDLSLIRVREGDAGGGREPVVERVAVGHHLLLGGDNMDLALAHLCESRLGGGKLDAARFGQLVSACRSAKEQLLAEGAPERVRITLLGHGARLIGNTLATELTREETERVVLDGFFPETTRDAKPERRRGALVAFGLPYEHDPAVTRHVAAFFERHAKGAAGPTAVLLNGGVFLAARIADRLVDTIRGWGGPPLERLPHADPDLAVARGAVAYALARRGHGLRIGGGAARGYYVGVDEARTDTSRTAHAEGPRRAVCVVPRGAEENVAHVATGRTLSLVVGRPVRFELFASDTANDRPGDVVLVDAIDDDNRFAALPPLTAALPGAGKRAEQVPVELEGELTAVGTLDLACVEVAAPRRRFRLAFQLREGAEQEPAAETPLPPATQRGSIPPGAKRVAEAREAIERVFGKGRPDVAPREVKDLVRELERLLGERGSWSIDVSRALFDVVGPSHRARRRTADHERVYWQLAGFTLRPGFGDPLDAQRAGELTPLFAEKVLFPQEPRGWQQFWIAWRRAAGGLDEAAQVAMRDVLDPLLAPSEARLKKPKGWKAEAPDDLLELAAWLERVPAARRALLGGWILERTWTSKDPALWAALGRIGARVPAYASPHNVVSPTTAERWVDHLLREKWDALPTAAQAAVQLTRLTGDRARDVSDRARAEVLRRLTAIGASDALVQVVREYVPVAEADRAALFGEGLPVGLRLVE
jgi:molecular chaperone DnaK (HSP70)